MPARVSSRVCAARHCCSVTRSLFEKALSPMGARGDFLTRPPSRGGRRDRPAGTRAGTGTPWGWAGICPGTARAACWRTRTACSRCGSAPSRRTGATPGRWGAPRRPAFGTAFGTRPSRRHPSRRRRSRDFFGASRPSRRSRASVTSETSETSESCLSVRVARRARARAFSPPAASERASASRAASLLLIRRRARADSPTPPGAPPPARGARPRPETRPHPRGCRAARAQSARARRPPPPCAATCRGGTSTRACAAPRPSARQS